MTNETTATAIKRLKAHRARPTRQQYSTLKGQVLAGDSDGAMRWLDKILWKKQAAAGGVNEGR